MRITNKIMQNNSLNNINKNKILQDKLNTQMSTEKKINRPSDDPVIAIRALRLRSNLTEISQYYEKNVPDANSWLEITEKALTTTSDVLEDMYKNCHDAVSKTNSSDRKILLDSIKALRNELYATGDADFAGRSVFTGYRTNTKLTFQKDTTQKYQISEQLSRKDIDQTTYVKTAKSASDNLANVSNTNYGAGGTGITVTDQDIQSVDVYRFRLAYDNLDASDVTLQWGAYKGADGSIQFTETLTLDAANAANSYDIPSPYESVTDDSVIYVKDTGEILLGKNAYNKMMANSDAPGTLDVDEAEIRITYEKSDWDKGDLNPVHYFACNTTENGSTIKYNDSFLQNKNNKQDIEYDIGFNQSIKVNTTADKAFTHAMGRDVDELIQSLQEVIDMEGVVSTLNGIVEANPNDQDAKDRLEAANKALTLLKDKQQKMVESSVTKMQGHVNTITQAITDCGTLSARLEMAEKRLESQQTTFDTLASENEDIDITKVAIEMSSAELSYQAALMATGKIAQNTLLNYL